VAADRVRSRGCFYQPPLNAAGENRGRLIKHGRYYWLLLAERGQNRPLLRLEKPFGLKTGLELSV
jgi:hypothetical protein